MVIDGSLFCWCACQAHLRTKQTSAEKAATRQKKTETMARLRANKSVDESAALLKADALARVSGPREESVGSLVLILQLVCCNYTLLSR